VSRLDALPEIAQKQPLQLATLVIPPTIESLYAASFEEHGGSEALPNLELSATPDTESEIEVATPAAPAPLSLAHVETDAAPASIEPFFDPLAALAEPIAAPVVPRRPESQPLATTEADAAPQGFTLAVPRTLPISNADRIFAALALKPRLAAWVALSRLPSSLDTGADPIAESPVLAAPQPLLLAHSEADSAAGVIVPHFDPLAALAEPVAAEPALPKPLPTVEAEAAAPCEALALGVPNLLPHLRTDRIFSGLAIAPQFGNWANLSPRQAPLDLDDTPAGAPTLSAPTVLAFAHPELAAAAPEESVFDPLATLAEPIEAEPTPPEPQAAAPSEVEPAELQTLAALDALPLGQGPDVTALLPEAESIAQFSASPVLPELQPNFDVGAETPADPPVVLGAPEPLALGDAELEGFAESDAGLLPTTLDQPDDPEAETPEPSSTVAPAVEMLAETPALVPAEARSLIEAPKEPTEAIVETPAIQALVAAAQPGGVDHVAFAEPAGDPSLAALDQPAVLGTEVPQTPSSMALAPEVEEEAPAPAEVQLLLEAMRQPGEGKVEPAPIPAPVALIQSPAIEAEPSPLAAVEPPTVEAPEQPVTEVVEVFAAATVDAAESVIEPASHTAETFASEPEDEESVGADVGGAVASIIEEPATDLAPIGGAPLVTEPEQREPVTKPADEAVATGAESSPEPVPLAAQPLASEPVAEQESEFSVDAEVDPNAERRAAVAALTEQLSSVVGSVLENKNYPKVAELRPRGHPEQRAATERAGTRAARQATPTAAERQAGSGIVVNLPRKQPAVRRRYWMRTGMAAASAMMIIASGFVAFGLSNQPRSNAPSVHPVVAATPAPAAPEPAPLASTVTPQIEEPASIPEPIAPPPPQPKPANQKVHHPAGTRTK
jgi:hypothetical protein